MSIGVMQMVRLTKAIWEIAKKKGFVEIVERQANGRIAAIAKCAIEQVTADPRKNIVNKALSLVFNNANPLQAVAGGVGSVSSLANNVQTELVRRAVKENGEMIRALSSQVGMLFSGVAAIKGVIWLNAGLSLANIGISAAGFMIIHSKLEKLSGEIDALAQEVQDVKDIILESDYIKPAKRLVSESKVICHKVTNNQELTANELEKLIKEYSELLDSTLRIGDKLPLDKMLQVVYDLLPIFSNLIALYYERFYYDLGKHPLHGEWMDIFDRVENKNFVNRIADFYYLNGRHNADVRQILDCNTLLCSSYRLKVKDTLELLEMCETREKYEAVNDLIDRNARENAAEFMEALKDEYTPEEAKEIIQSSTIQALGVSA